MPGVSPSGYCAWRARGPSRRSQSDEGLLGRIEAIHARSHGTYGAPRIHAELREQGVCAARKRIERLMRQAGLAGVSRRKGTATTQRRAKAPPAPDLVQRDFAAERPDELYVADITYVPTWAGFLFLAVVLDACTRRVVGWSMANHLRTELVLGALNMALHQRRPASVIHHSDRARNTRPWPSGSAAGRPARARPWVRQATATITRCAKASSPPWNAN